MYPVEGGVHIDLKIMQGVRDLMPGKFNALVDQYISTTTKALARAEKATADRQAREVAEIMHALKSSSASLGLMLVAQLAKDLETVTDAMEDDGIGDWPAIAGFLEAVRESFITASDCLRRELEALP
jgi:HPt (histidine-containing phosphotransfer) domain-containing protein